MSALVKTESTAHVQWVLAGADVGADADLQRENIAHLCTHMLWLRSWWDSHRDALRAIDSKAACEIHDHFVDGAIYARSTVRGMKLELDVDEQLIKNYRWGNSTQILRMIVAPPSREGRAA